MALRGALPGALRGSKSAGDFVSLVVFFYSRDWEVKEGH